MPGIILRAFVFLMQVILIIFYKKINIILNLLVKKLAQERITKKLKFLPRWSVLMFHAFNHLAIKKGPSERRGEA